jgi:hypothetical protein
MNDIALAGSLATAPSSAFVELRERPRFWFPLLVIILSTVAVVYWYYSVVDIEWLKDTMFANNPALNEQQRAAAMGFTTRTTMLWSGVVGTVIVIPLFLVVHSLILMLIAKATRLPFGFKHWFALVSWSSLAGLLNIVVGAILLLMSDTSQVAPGILAPLSVNELLVHLPMNSPGEGLLQTLGIPSFLSWALMIIGVKTWSQRTWLYSASVILLPLVVVFGLWAFISFH